MTRRDKTNLLRCILPMMAIALMSTFSVMDLHAFGLRNLKGSAAVSVERDANYYYGTGYGESYGEACEQARADLLGNIVVTVESSTSSFYSETSGTGNDTIVNEFSSIVKSYTSATTLNNLTYKTISSTPEFVVQCQVSKEDVAKMYEQRQSKVLDLVLGAQRAESRGAVGNALRYLYQAYVLLHSLQYPYEVKERVDGQQRILANWIPERMNEICSDVKFAIVSNEGNIYNLLITYKDQPVTGIDYSYWNGRRQSPVIGAKDGIGVMEFPDDMKPSKVNVKIEYEYRDEVNSDAQVAPLLLAFNGQSVVRENVKQMDFSRKEFLASKIEKKTYAQSMVAGKAEGVIPVGKSIAHSYSDTMDGIAKAIASKNYESAAVYFTDEGREMYRSLLQYGNARLLTKPDKIEYEFYPMGERTVCRSIPMQFSFSGGKKNFIEDVTFTFNADGKVESLAFGLGSEASKCVFSQGGDKWTDYTKMVIVNFLENYKTAFALKRIEYIRSIFDDDAYIIIGHVVKKSHNRKPQGDLDVLGKSLYKGNADVQYYKKTKEEYLKQLEKCFKSNEYVNIRFADSDVAKAGFGGETFGIQIKQDYSSSSYGDQGFLFLMVDFNNEEAPVITIRTWQPERVKDLTPNLPRNSRDFGIFSLGYFS